jgi:putative endonuclease
MRKYYVYILTNKSKTLYIGITNNLRRRVSEHKNAQIKGFTAKYNIGRLAYFEEYNNPRDAIIREKQLKGWLRQKKVRLINSVNPKWDDLSERL